MTTHISLRPTAIALTLLLAAVGPAFAACTTLPDGPDSYNVANGQQRSLCLQQQLHDNTVDRNTQTQISGIRTAIEQQQIQRRFDNLQVITPLPPWQR